MAVVVIVVRCTYLSTGTRILPARSRCHVRCWRLPASASVRFLVAAYAAETARCAAGWASCPEEAVGSKLRRRRASPLLAAWVRPRLETLSRVRSRALQRDTRIIEESLSCVRVALHLTPALDRKPHRSMDSATRRRRGLPLSWRRVREARASEAEGGRGGTLSQ